jgi:chromosomal replication initiation ATPase DnaA
MTYTIEAIIRAAKFADISEESVSLLTRILVRNNRLDYTLKTVDKFFNDVCSVSGFTAEQLQSKISTRPLTYTRHSYASLAHDLFPKHSLGYIGSFINKSHSMIIYYCKEVPRIKEKSEFCEYIKTKLIIKSQTEEF